MKSLKISLLFLFTAIAILAFSQSPQENSYKPNIPQRSKTNQLYAWEKPHAQVIATGDLQWAPLPFVYTPGASVKYIDFDNGNDNSDGNSTSSAWKHHPWDPAATGVAVNTTGIHTYVFKRGVVYRGALTAKESGVDGNPIRLTSDPNWGTGEASICGSIKITSGWTKANSSIAPKIPNADQVWYRTLSGVNIATKVVCEVTNEGIKRVRVARSPNYVDNKNEPMKDWWMFTDKVKVGTTSLNLVDTKNLTQTPVDYYQGGDIWAIEDVVVMCTLWKQRINSYNPTTKTITVADQNFGGKNCKYYVENTPYMLDVPGEFYYDQNTNRLYLRLEGDKDPNTTTIEVATKSLLMTISSKNYIDISGLTFGFTTSDNLRYGQSDGNPTLSISNASNIDIKNCKFQYLNGGVMGTGTCTNWNFTDNEMNFMDDFSFALDGWGTDDMYILRNKIYENGTRHLGRWYSSINAIGGTLKVGEIAGNIIEHSWGSGINFIWGKGGAENILFIRGLVHHNRVSHCLQGVNDYGGIESWQGGPVYTFNNIVEDAQGFKYNTMPGYVNSLGYSFYFDGAFKQYVFNNIVKGRGWGYNASAYNTVLGFYNVYANNNAYNVGSLTTSGGGNLAMDGYNYFLSNVSDSTWRQLNHTAIASGMPFESMSNNVFARRDFLGNFLDYGFNVPPVLTFDGFVSKFKSFKPECAQVGFETAAKVFENPAKGDYRPTVNSELIDKSAKYFMPFALSNVVGEWHFIKHNADSSLIKGENFFFSQEYYGRESYKNVPKNHLKTYGLNSNSFVYGELEDFAPGALKFDGISTYCSGNEAQTSTKICNDVNLSTNNATLELFFKTEPNHINGTILSKYGTVGYGYLLNIDASGNIVFSLMNGGVAVFSKSGSKAINDGLWHHVVLEMNRQTKVVIVYIDGIEANGATIGTMPSNSAITNSTNLWIGKSPEGNFFSGSIDFLRISKNTLAKARTTIDELYKWEFDGPYMRDFNGNLPIGKRDAGAIERGSKLCNMTISQNTLIFDQNGGTLTFDVAADQGFIISKKVGKFFTYTLSDNQVKVNVPASIITSPLTAELWIVGCNETQKVKIIQQTSTGISNSQVLPVKIMPNPVTANFITISVPNKVRRCDASIVDLNGKIMSEFVVYGGTNSIEINMAKGIYILKISSPEVNFREKMVVK